MSFDLRPFIYQNKYPIQDDESSYHNSLQAYLIEGIGHCISMES